MNTQKIATDCRNKLDLPNFKMGDEFFYQSLSLCVIDSIFSIGVKYESVKKVIKNFCEYENIDTYRKNKSEFPEINLQYNTKQFLENFSKVSSEELAKKIFKNRQRTSTRSGILKAEAVVKFIEILVKHNIYHFQDMYRFSKDIETEIRLIPGQGSGISTQYFLMLAGNNDIIKPDRMIIRFIENSISQKVRPEDAQELIDEVSKYINEHFKIKITARELDNAIWNYQRNQQTN